MQGYSLWVYVCNSPDPGNILRMKVIHYELTCATILCCPKKGFAVVTHYFWLWQYFCSLFLDDPWNSGRRDVMQMSSHLYQGDQWCPPRVGPWQSCQILFSSLNRAAKVIKTTHGVSQGHHDPGNLLITTRVSFPAGLEMRSTRTLRRDPCLGKTCISCTVQNKTSISIWRVGWDEKALGCKWCVGDTGDPKMPRSEVKSMFWGEHGHLQTG